MTSIQPTPQDVVQQILGAVDVTRTSANPLPVGRQAIVVSLDTAAAIQKGRTAQTIQIIEVSTDNGQTWQELTRFIHENPPSTNPHTGLPYDAHYAFTNVVVTDQAALVRIAVDPKGVALDTTAKLSVLAVVDQQAGVTKDAA